MKAYLFIETGETRYPKEGEWFNGSGGYLEAKYDFSNYQFPILVRHELTMPDEATECRMNYNLKDSGWINGMPISIPCPKKKVKKWRWAVEDANGNWVVTGHMTAKEVLELPWRKTSHIVDETEIEVCE